MMFTGLCLDESCTADDITDLHGTTFLLVLQCVHVVIISVFLRRVFVILSIDVIVLYSS
jgi:hypothetical protein